MPYIYTDIVNYKKRVIFISFSLWLSAANTSARETEDYMTLDLEQLLQVKVTGATLRDESLASAPTAVTVFNRAQLNNLGMDYLYELLSLVPGYQFNRNADSPAGYTFSARGRRNSSEAREVLLLVDGRVFSDSRTGGADGSLPFFPLSQIERVEVIRGPGSALYGSNAMTGVINIVTRKQENQVTLATGSQGRASADLLLSYNQDDWDFNLFARSYADQGQQYNFGSEAALMETQDPVRANNIDLSIGRHSTQLSFTYHRVRTEDFFVAESIDNNINEYLQLFRNVDLKQDWQVAPDFRSHWQASYTDIRQELAFTALPAAALAAVSEPASSAPLVLKGVLAGDTYQLVNNNDWTLSSTASMQFGFDWHQQRETQAYAYNNFDLGQLVLGEFPVQYYGDLSHLTPVGLGHSQRALGIYSQYLYQFSSSGRLNLGLRYDDYQNIGAHLSPRLGWVQQLTEQQTLKLLYGEAYRAPSLSEMGLINNPVLVGNPDLRYEIVKTWDVIWMHNSQEFRIVADWFHSRYKAPIGTGFLGSTRTYINGDDESSQGVELELSRQLNSRWLINATYTHFTDLPDTAFREARQLASLVLNYDYKMWNINFSGVYSGERYATKTADFERELTGQWQLQSKVGYSFNQKTELVFQIKNLLNARIQTPAQGLTLQDGVPNRGREWHLGIQFQL